MKKKSLLTGEKILEEVSSPINGRIKVIRSLAFGTYIQVEGLTQSGGVIRGIWKKALREVKKEKKEVKKLLVLGVGGGTVVKISKKLWPEVEITGVDIDPEMVRLGKKYLGIEDAKIKIAEAFDFVKDSKQKYDLILVDTYIFDEYPKKLESKEFLENLKRILNKDGLAVFNRLYWDGKRKLAHKFGDRLEETFSDVKIVYPEANVMFICSE